MSPFKYRKKLKSKGAKSGEYGGNGMGLIFNYRTASAEMCLVSIIMLQD